MGQHVPQIARDVRRLRADIQTAVRSFPRFHKYGIGEELRGQARKLHDLVVWWWNEPDQRPYWAERLVHAIDVLKEDLEVAKEDEVFPRGFPQFEHLLRQADSIGAQAGGIRRNERARKKHPKGQNAQGNAGAQRAQKLSTPATPNGVYV